ncbi:MAG: DUF2155 domain-containing protein [Pseudomonadota bacterium]
MKLLATAALLAAAPVVAQDTGQIGQELAPLPGFSLEIDELIDRQIENETLDVGPGEPEYLSVARPREAPVVRVETAAGALLRGIDKVSGEVRDIELAAGGQETLGRLTVELGECRFPTDNPNGDAFAFLTVRAAGLDRPAFEGWMVASSPALSALDHPRYDVWVIRCMSS